MRESVMGLEITIRRSDGVTVDYEKKRNGVKVHRER